MTREEAIKILRSKIRTDSFDESFEEIMMDCVLTMAIADMEKQIQWQKTEKYNRMIEAFECDFALIEQGEKTFAELDQLMNDKRYSLAEHMELLQELSTLLRYGKAEIYVKGEEND